MFINIDEMNMLQFVILQMSHPRILEHQILMGWKMGILTSMLLLFRTEITG